MIDRNRSDQLKKRSVHHHSRFIRRMRLILPTIALGLLAVVLTWSNLPEDEIISRVENTADMSTTIGQNELLNPRFESTDEKKQPFTITAKRAVQSGQDDDLVMLEQPMADISLNSGNWVALEAEKGAFDQTSKRLSLQGNVRLYHDAGYQIETAKLDIDLPNQIAASDQAINGQGPAGTLSASGLTANGNSGELILTGPAKLVLSRAVLPFDDKKHNEEKKP